MKDKYKVIAHFGAQSIKAHTGSLQVTSSWWPHGQV